MPLNVQTHACIDIHHAFSADVQTVLRACRRLQELNLARAHATIDSEIEKLQLVFWVAKRKKVVQSRSRQRVYAVISSIQGTKHASTSAHDAGTTTIATTLYIVPQKVI